MTVLLDTHVWLWMLTAPGRLATRAREVVEDAGNTLLLSAASSWEIAIKHSVGRLALPEAPERYVPDRMAATGVEPLPVGHSHALRVASLPTLHRDPFDRILIAQSQLERVALLTADAVFGRYDVATIAAA